MTISNLAVVFGPTLIGVGAGLDGNQNGGPVMVDAVLQNKVSSLSPS